MLELDENAKHFSFLLFDKEEIPDRICQFVVEEDQDAIVVITWNGLLQYHSIGVGQQTRVNVVEKEANNEFCESLCYHAKSSLVAVGSVLMNGKDQFIQNRIHLYKLIEDRFEKYGQLITEFSPSKSNQNRLKFFRSIQPIHFLVDQQR